MVLRGTLTDLQTYKIIDGIMKPLFREGKYGEGIQQAVQTVVETIQGDTSRLDAIVSTSSSLQKAFLE